MGSPGVDLRLADKDSNDADRFPLYSTIAAFIVFIAIGIVFIAIGIVCPPDISFFLTLFIGVPTLFVAGLVAAICAAFSKNRRRYLNQLLALAILSAISASLLVYDFKHPLLIRSASRWMMWSHGYKQQVLAQPTSASGELKHIAWDGWGFAGIDTSVFLVFDPANSLAAAAISGRPGKFNGIPCEVFLVRRLESHWYTVQGYTGQSWDNCN
jgi:hypothetical protein